MHEALPTLLFPFERGVLDPPEEGKHALLFGAGAGLKLPADFGAELHVVQDFRPDFLALVKAGFSASPQAEGEDYDAALLLLGRHRRENEARLAEALRRVRPGGLIAAAGTRKDGAAALAKRTGELFQAGDRLSKHHGVVFWLHRPKALNAEVLKALSAPASPSPEEYETATGGFSEGVVDAGSKLLADSLPDDISGAVADFGAGWGYLSLRAAERYSLFALHLYEAHFPSLEAARRNLAARAPGTDCRFFWHDLLSEPVEQRYDVILMNPPFHHGRAAEPDMGRAMIGVAAKSLRPGGRLFLVANRGLPYEPALREGFSRHGELRRDETYKILWGQK